jgi:DnaK suppressor protein
MPRRHLKVNQIEASPSEQIALLRDVLHRLRDEEVRRLKGLIRSETAQRLSAPGDQLDDASQNQQTEFQAGLIDMSERRLGAILRTFDRLDDGQYGICEECGEQISFERLRVIPTAVHCLECQSQLEAATIRSSH